jgi:hypothetical protein
MTIDWQTFSERVPAGTRVRVIVHSMVRVREGLGGIVSFKGKEGLIVHHGYDDTDEAHNPFRIQSPLFPCDMEHPAIQFFDENFARAMSPHDLEYLIDGTWVSYAQLMTGEM